MSKLIQDLSNFDGEELHLTMDQIKELHENIKSSIDLSSIDFATKTNGYYGNVKSIPIYIKS